MIKLFLTDLDGCLTDGSYYVGSSSGSLMKKFNTKDFMGLENLTKQGIEVGIITNSHDNVIDYKMKAFPFPVELHKRVGNKLEYVDNLIYDKCAMDEIAYIGDDVNDLELLNAVGVAACPKDAHIEVIQAIFRRHAENDSGDAWVSDINGGQGCVRWFADMFLTE